MTNKEAFKLCLDDRIAKREQLTKELEEITIAFEKVNREEHMYYYLVTHRGNTYKELFSNKHEISQENENKLREEKETIEKELKLLEIEIEYLETQVK